MQEILQQISELEQKLKKGFEECDKLLSKDYPNKQTAEFYAARRKCSDLQSKIGKLVGVYVELQNNNRKEKSSQECINPNYRPVEKTSRYVTSTTWERADKKQSKQIIERLINRTRGI